MFYTKIRQLDSCRGVAKPHLVGLMFVMMMENNQNYFLFFVSKVLKIKIETKSKSSTKESLVD